MAKRIRLEAYEVFGGFGGEVAIPREENLEKYNSLVRDEYGNIIEDDETNYEEE